MMIRSRLISALILSVLVCLAGASCWRSSTSVETNANTSDISVAEITDAAQALSLGDQLFENNETERAIEAYLRATELDPDLADAWFKLGIAYALVEKAQALDAQNDVNATTETQTGKPEKPNSEKAFRKAIDAYKKLLDREPENAAAYFDLGRSYNKLNEDEEAAKALKQAVKLNPEDTQYQTELGAILIKLAQYREAIPPLKRALELDPENSRAAELLEDAEAGRTRVDYVPPRTGGNTNANANSNSNSSTSNTNASQSNSAKPTPTARSTPRPPAERRTPRPNEQ